MKTISASRITATVKGLCLKAGLDLRQDVRSALRNARAKEKDPKAKKILGAIIDNYLLARKERLAICQDTGLSCVFVELGQEVKVAGDLKAAIQKGIDAGYRLGYFRPSIVSDPLARGASRHTPAIIHIDVVRGSRLKLSVLPKGFGCENKAQLKMFNPTARPDEIRKFIVDAVKAAGPDACPPYVVGVGIGGTADYAMHLAKKALLRNIFAKPSPAVRQLTKQLTHELNNLAIGPMGLGGRNTVLGVRIETFPTHIAGLPVAVNISCHALRSACATL